MSRNEGQTEHKARWKVNMKVVQCVVWYNQRQEGEHEERKEGGAGESFPALAHETIDTQCFVVSLERYDRRAAGNCHSNADPAFRAFQTGRKCRASNGPELAGGSGLDHIAAHASSYRSALRPHARKTREAPPLSSHRRGTGDNEHTSPGKCQHHRLFSRRPGPPAYRHQHHQPCLPKPGTRSRARGAARNNLRLCRWTDDPGQYGKPGTGCLSARWRQSAYISREYGAPERGNLLYGHRYIANHRYSDYGPWHP